ncbi:MAG: FmdB family zinc ribbon protein [bacterium]
MPTYEYKCKGCGNKFEVRQKMNDDPIKVCPQCGGEVRKLIGTPHGIVKGRNPMPLRGSEIRCGKESTCCGRPVPCSKRPCDD